MKHTNEFTAIHSVVSIQSYKYTLLLTKHSIGLTKEIMNVVHIINCHVKTMERFYTYKEINVRNQINYTNIVT
jgi:hypothetical protein